MASKLKDFLRGGIWMIINEVGPSGIPPPWHLSKRSSVHPSKVSCLIKGDCVKVVIDSLATKERLEFVVKDVVVVLSNRRS